ncbi:hypothetical protein DERP_009478 [Dermatophagoides pteronyssinus]|uniref:Uncharacterized protein n=1 Tax=Dermatophagoides pteronyssinus TaxID=6956 RepID=A0ABQ8IU92_DERPT|nr:hypothetical protein DERP_009478 [Dermatophagoides pteronyssinus]
MTMIRCGSCIGIRSCITDITNKFKVILSETNTIDKRFKIIIPPPPPLPPLTILPSLFVDIIIFVVVCSIIGSLDCISSKINGFMTCCDNNNNNKVDNMWG